MTDPKQRAAETDAEAWMRSRPRNDDLVLQLKIARERADIERSRKNTGRDLLLAAEDEE